MKLYMGIVTLVTLCALNGQSPEKRKLSDMSIISVKKQKTDSSLEINPLIIIEPVTDILKTIIRSYCSIVKNASLVNLTDVNFSAWIREIFKTRELNGVTLSPDGAYVIIRGCDKSVRLWRADQNTARVFKGFDAHATCFAMNETGELFIMGCSNGLLIAWDLTKNKQHACSSVNKHITSIVFADAHDFFTVTTSDGGSTTWYLNLPENEGAVLMQKHITEIPDKRIQQAQQYLTYCLKHLFAPHNQPITNEQDMWPLYLEMYHACMAIKELFILDWNKAQAEIALAKLLPFARTIPGQYRQQVEDRVTELRTFLQKSREEYEKELNDSAQELKLAELRRKLIDTQEKKANREAEEQARLSKLLSNYVQTTKEELSKLPTETIDSEETSIVKDVREKETVCFFELRNEKKWSLLSEAQKLHMIGVTLKSIEARFWIELDTQAAIKRFRYLIALYTNLCKFSPLSDKSREHIQKQLAIIVDAFTMGAPIRQKHIEQLQEILVAQRNYAKVREDYINTVKQCFEASSDSEFRAKCIEEAINEFQAVIYESGGQSSQAQSTETNLVSAHGKYTASANGLHQSQNFLLPTDMLPAVNTEVRYKTAALLLLENQIETSKANIKKMIEEMQARVAK